MLFPLCFLLQENGNNLTVHDLLNDRNSWYEIHIFHNMIFVFLLINRLCFIQFVNDSEEFYDNDK